MIKEYDKKILTEAGRDYIYDIVVASKYLKETISFKEHILLCDQVNELTYEEVISLTITEDIRAFEGKFSKFLKYSIAAIAGMALGGLAAPPVSMFVLFLYRKATDTCERSCFRKLPLSKERKICKYGCQLNAAKKMATDIRTEMSKCSQFTRAASCEKKLQKEYIKWAKRVQLLTVKLNRAKMDAAEKQRKRQVRDLTKNTKRISAGLDLTGNNLADYIAENIELRHNLSFEKHLELYKSVVNEDEDNPVAPVKVDPKKEKQIRQAMYLGLWIVPIPFFNDLVNYMVKKYSFGCAGKCTAKNMPKDVCYNQCAYLGAKYAVAELTKQMGKCKNADTPEKEYKCKKRVMKLREDWKVREVERKHKFEMVLKQRLQDAKVKNQKSREKEQNKQDKINAKQNKVDRAHY